MAAADLVAVPVGVGSLAEAVVVLLTTGGSSEGTVREAEAGSTGP